MNNHFVKHSISQITLSIVREDKNLRSYSGEKYNIFHISLIHDFIESMEPYQQFHNTGTFIGIEMNRAAEEFIVFLILFVVQMKKDLQLLDRIIPDEMAEKLYDRYIYKTESRDSLKRFLDLMGLRVEEIDIWTEASIRDFQMILLKKVNPIKSKERIINPAIKQ